MLQRTFLTGVALLLLAAQACGGGDGKKKVGPAADAGMGGQAGSPDLPVGGSPAGSPGEPGGVGGEPRPAAGMGGMPEVPAGGTGGVLDIAAGAGGQPAPPEPELLFTVKGQGGTPGLPGTALNAEPHPQNSIYTSSTGSQDRVNGTNAVKVTGVSMGLDPTDDIVAFSLLQPEPENPLFLFTVADGSQGAYQSRVNRAYNEAGNDEQGNLYYSEGTQSTRYVGEGGDQYGYNAMLATQASLGLVGGDPEGFYPDDLTGLAVHDARLPLGDLYFTVAPNAVGAPDSAVASVPEDERGCTVFKSAGDGSNTVAYSCTELGLVAGDRVDGLALWGDGEPTNIVFSVNVNAQGAVDTAVSTAALVNDPVGATLFSSPGDGSNDVLKSQRDLGLGELSADDDIDGFTVVPAPVEHKVTHATTCELARDPYDAETGFATLTGVSHVGSNVLVLFGQTSDQVNRLLAYNARTCAFLQQKDLPAGFENPQNLAIVPLAGWAVESPLDNVEYLGVNWAGTGIEKAITRYDVDGAVVAAFTITDSYYGDQVVALVHDPVADRLYMLINQYRWATLWAMPRPLPTDTVLTATYRDLTTPCANEVSINGTDASGNLLLAKWQASGTYFEVCGFNPLGELVPLPHAWSVSATPNATRGFIGANGAHFILHEDVVPMTIERGTYQSP